MKDTSPYDDPAPFNMAMLYYYNLNRDILSPKDEAIRNADYAAWYWCLVALYHKIAFRMRQEEKDRVCLRLRQVESNMQYLGTSTSRRVRMPKIKLLLSQVDTELMDIMNKNSMIFPNIEFRDPLDKIRRDMQLEPKNQKRGTTQ